MCIEYIIRTYVAIIAMWHDTWSYCPAKLFSTLWPQMMTNSAGAVGAEIIAPMLKMANNYHFKVPHSHKFGDFAKLYGRWFGSSTFFFFKIHAESQITFGLDTLRVTMNPHFHRIYKIWWPLCECNIVTRHKCQKAITILHNKAK